MMQENNSKRRVLVIGLDGATWTVLKPLIEEGYMPNLKRLVENGVSGDLISTIPSHSGPAWASFITGKNPGKHGIFGFLKLLKQEEKSRIINSYDIQGKTILQILSEAGKKVGFINLPILYPPIKVNGFVVGSELLWSSLDAEFTYPEDLFEKIGISKEEYFLKKDINLKGDNIEEFLSQLNGRLERRQRLTLELIYKFDWDFMGVVISEIDTLQHYLWHIIDKNHPRYNENEAQRIKSLVINLFRRVDLIIEDLLNLISDNTQVIFISDHGFGAFERHIKVNELLKKFGFLYLKPKTLKEQLLILQRDIRGFLNKKFLLYRLAKRLIKESINKNLNSKVINKSPEEKLGFRSSTKLISKIDWKRTRAYFVSDTGSGVYINLEGREPQGIVRGKDEYEKVRNGVIAILEGLKNPKDGSNLDIKVFKKEAVYSGNCLGSAPDLIVDNNSSCKFSFILDGEKSDNNIFKETNFTGWHRKKGIVLMYGSCFKRGPNLENANIVDIAPTILYLLSTAIPDDIDGQVIQEAIDKDFLTQNSISYQRTSSKDKEIFQEKQAYSEDDLAKIEQRLNDLGYLG